MSDASAFSSRPPGERARVDFERIAASVDLPALLAREGIEVRRGKAFCPFHDNSATPAMSVFRAEGRWRYNCHSCGASGDAIAWVAARENVSALEAARKLGGDTDYLVRASGTPAREARPQAPEHWRDAEWQRVVDALVIEAEARLWSPEGRDALEWLRARGLEGHTIRRFRLGFVATAYRSGPIAALNEGRRPGIIYAPRGVVIPWVAPRTSYSTAGDEAAEVPRWVGCNVRRLAEPDVFGELPDGVEKCLAVRGSRRGHLYPWPEVLPTQGDLPVLLVEGEFDALIGFQEFGHLMHVVTAGSASVRSLPLATGATLALSSSILLALDHDQAGVEAVWEWRERYPYKSRRVLLPFGKDLSDFVNGGGDALGWAAGLASAQP